MLYDIPSSLLVIILLIAMVLTVEIGIRIGRKYGEQTWLNAHGIHTTLTAATLALMGLLLAFTFNLSVTRYEMRKSLIVDEAVAIQSVRSDLEFVGQPRRAQALRLLRAYTLQRIQYLMVGNNPQGEQKAVEQSRALHGLLWAIAIDRASYDQIDPQIRGSQYSSLTRDLLQLNAVAREREQARVRRVPEPVIMMLLAVAIGSAAILSYMSGASGQPDRLPAYAVLALICLIIYLIIDFDRPRRGLFHVDPTPLAQLVPSLRDY